MARSTDRPGGPARRLLCDARTRAVLSLGLLLGFGSLGTYAYWSDTAAVNGGPISSGAMDLQFDTNGAVGPGTAYDKTSLTWSGLAPDERKAFALTVRNVGNPPMRYSATVTRGSTPAWTYIGTPVTVQVFSGTPQADSTYPQQDSCTGAAIGTQQSVDGTQKPVIPARDLVAGGSEQVCIVVGLAASAGNDNQGRTGSITLAFTGNQRP